MRRFSIALLAAAPLWLAGCDLLGIEPASAVAARREAEGKAIGGACRHAARSIETCYEMNKRADKAAIFAGWREMNDYMRENKIDAMPAAAAVAAVARHADEATDAADATPPAGPGKPARARAAAAAAASGAKATQPRS
jgi:hypothetical protein